MKAFLTVLATLALAGAAAAQSDQKPPADPLAVKPIESGAEATELDVIRTKLERLGYTEVAELSRDSSGLWHARATREGETLQVIVDKGGRVKPAP
ncbi:hypothetical protein [Reyranella sp.]|uniref:hypothetical protein n=1 Tax=Reyranella sp. TaxID=1929291 RepID=UPI003BA9D2A9